MAGGAAGAGAAETASTARATSAKEAGDAVHGAKHGLDGNPDVWVDEQGNIYPLNDDGTLGDMHDNLYDHLPKKR